MASERFDIDRMMDSSGKVDLSDIRWDDVPKYPITAEGLRAIRYFLRTESSTFFYVKTLLKTRAAYAEPDIAPFICAWMYEEEFHGRAFQRFLRAYGQPPGRDERALMFERRAIGERIDEISQTTLCRVFPSRWPAVHMVWGVIQEFTTYHGYLSLIERVNHPVLNEICDRIMRQELRHFAFYRAQAVKRLEGDRITQKIVNGALRLGWTPVGDGMNERAEVLHALRFLFDGREGSVIPEIERRIQQVPGLEWFDLFTRYVERYELSKAPASWFNERRAAQRRPAPRQALSA
jgi:rubrerythrin